MKKSLLIIIGIIAAVIFMFYGTYNGLVQQNEEVKSVWAKVETQYQRRGDLIDNLVNTVKGYADFEKSTLTEVIEARSEATKVTLKSDDLTPENIALYQKAQGQLSSSLSRLLVSVEQYPNLKANEGFLKLQDELAGTENRIAVARDNFNEAAKSYNIYVQTFPRNILAGIFNFHVKGYFEADAENKKAPSVKF